MAHKVHQVETYNYSFSARSGAIDRLQLWGAGGARLAEIRFVADGSRVPEPVILPELSGARCSFHRSAAPGIIDMLRHESPVKLTVNDSGPFVFLHTGSEPVGEEET